MTRRIGPSARLDDNQRERDLTYKHLIADGRAIQLNGPINGTVNLYFGPNPEDQEIARRDQEKNAKEKLFQGPSSNDEAKAMHYVADQLPGTCDWIKRDPAYERWLHGDTDEARMLWITGRPGIGKSVITKYLAKELSQHTLRSETPDCQHGSLVLKYFFCYDRDQSSSSLAQGLLSQLVQAEPDLIRHVEPHFQLCKESGGLFNSANEPRLWATLQTALHNASTRNIVFVIDALDESRCSFDNFYGKIATLQECSTDVNCRLRIICSCRTGFCSKRVRHSTAIINLDAPEQRNLVNLDIKRYVRSLVTRPNCSTASTPTTKIISALMEKSQGLFLWAKLVTQQLERVQSATSDSILQNVLEMPSTLPEIYTRLVSSISHDDRRVAAAMMHGVLYACRPLTLDELPQVSSLSDADFRQFVGCPRRLEQFCGNLVVFQQDKVRLIHQTAREFLLNIDTTDPNVSWLASNSQDSHYQIAKRLYPYLADIYYDKQSERNSSTIQASAISLVHKYASEYWLEHTLQASSSRISELFNPDDAFCTPDSMVRYHWVKQNYKADLHGLQKPTDFDMIYFTAFFGMPSVLSKWLDLTKLTTKRQKDVNCMLPIHWASRNGHYDCVKLLLDHGASVHVKGRDMTPIVWAVHNGHVDIVQLLIECGSSVETVDRGLTPLGWAAWDGNEKVTSVLLDEGASVNPTPQLRVTQCLPNEIYFLRRIARKKDGELLLIRDRTVVQVTIASSYKVAFYGTLTACATSLSSYYIAEEIWNARYHYYEAPHISIHRGPFTISSSKALKALGGLVFVGIASLAYFVTFRVFCRPYMAIFTAATLGAGHLAPLHFSMSLATARAISSFMNVNTISLILACQTSSQWHAPSAILLVSGAILTLAVGSPFSLIISSSFMTLAGFVANIQQQLTADHTPVNLAASQGHEGIVRLLLRRGANLSWSRTETFLTRYRHHPTLNAILSHRASCQQRLDDRPSTLQLAALCSQTDLVTQLIECGADVNELSPRGFTALHTSVFAGHEDMTNLLLSRGAKANQVSKDFISPLLAGVCGGSWPVVNALLQEEVDVGQTNTEGVTPLHVAFLAGHKEIVKGLLDAGADDQRLDCQGLMPCNYACGDVDPGLASTEGLPELLRRVHKTLPRLVRKRSAKMLKKAVTLRRFDQLGFYLLKMGAREGAAQAYKWARRPDASPDSPWYVCRGCANTSPQTGHIRICDTCPITVGQAILCESCHGRANVHRKLVGCTEKHEFIPVDLERPATSNVEELDGVKDDEEDACLKRSQDAWLQEILSSPLAR